MSPPFGVGWEVWIVCAISGTIAIGIAFISVNLSQIATEHVVFSEGANTTLSCIVINI